MWGTCRDLLGIRRRPATLPHVRFLSGWEPGARERRQRQGRHAGRMGAVLRGLRRPPADVRPGHGVLGHSRCAVLHDRPVLVLSAHRVPGLRLRGVGRRHRDLQAARRRATTTATGDRGPVIAGRVAVGWRLTRAATEGSGSRVGSGEAWPDELVRPLPNRVELERRDERREARAEGPCASTRPDTSSASCGDTASPAKSPDDSAQLPRRMERQTVVDPGDRAVGPAANAVTALPVGVVDEHVEPANCRNRSACSSSSVSSAPRDRGRRTAAPCRRRAALRAARSGAEASRASDSSYVATSRWHSVPLRKSHSGRSPRRGL